MKLFIIFISIICLYLLLLIQKKKKDIIENWNSNFLSVNTNTELFTYFFDED